MSLAWPQGSKYTESSTPSIPITPPLAVLPPAHSCSLAARVLPTRDHPAWQAPTGVCVSDASVYTYIPTSRDMLNIVLGTTLGLNMAVAHFFGDYLDLEC